MAACLASSHGAWGGYIKKSAISVIMRKEKKKPEFCHVTLFVRLMFLSGDVVRGIVEVLGCY